MLNRLILLLALAPAASLAMMIFDEELTCPIDGEKFTQSRVGSGTSFGSYLDSRPYGPIPAPWPMAKCPATGFVIFSETLTPQELGQLRPVVQSAEYQQLQEQHTNYFLAAHLMQVLGRADREIAYMLVQASWEAETPQLAATYREAALSHYVSSFAFADPQAEAWVSDQMIAGELERRLGDFKASEHRFRSLAAGGHQLAPALAQIVQYQLRLIAMRNADAQLTPASYANVMSIQRPKD